MTRALLLLLGLVIAVHGLPTVSTLGLMVGNPWKGNIPAMSTFEDHFDNFTKALGAMPTYMDTFVDYTQPWSSWVSNAGWSAGSWANSTRSKNLIPVIAVGIMPASYLTNQTGGLNEVISGLHDAVFAGIIQTYINANFTKMHIRIGWEADGGWYSWNFVTKNSTGGYSLAPLWIAAFRRIATVMKAVPGATVLINWNPCNIQWTPVAVNLAYPGDDVVDVIALDIYSIVYPGSLWDWEFNNGTLAPNVSVWSQKFINRKKYWDYPAATQWANNSTGGWGMVSHLAFAKSRNKPVAICESGVGLGSAAATNGLYDDGDFPIYLRDSIVASGVEFTYISIWDVNVGDGGWMFTDGTKPLATAAWRTAFGAGAISTSTATTKASTSTSGSTENLDTSTSFASASSSPNTPSTTTTAHEDDTSSANSTVVWIFYMSLAYALLV